ncbi:GNAT family N-acetyltransferase [Streptomyces sp. NPDC057910]|uniref:GNAT family N-acetyltransferase n=1 Tax=Streptomyces sp. NPDC057910 TaxID=3346278 RepID=UPI0036E8F26C
MHSTPENSVIEGDLTCLIPATETHLPLLAAWFADPEFVRNWGGQPLTREEVSAKYTGRRRPDVESFLILDRNIPVGYAQYAPAGPGQGGIDMVLLPQAQGKGLGPDAARALVRHLHTMLGWTQVTVDPEASNTRAIRAWAKAGFRTVSRQSGHLLMESLPAHSISPADDEGLPPRA